MDAKLMSMIPKLLNHCIVSVFMTQVECCMDRAPVWVLPVSIKQPLVQWPVVRVDSIVESDHNHLWNLDEAQWFLEHHLLQRFQLLVYT